MLLLSPVQIGSLHLKNRMVMAPMATHLAAEDGSVTAVLKDYYEERARGGVAMITLESCFINQNGRGGIRRLGLYKDSLIPGIKEVTDVIHAHDSKVCCELHHGGPQCKSSIIGETPLCASGSFYQQGVIDPPRTVLREEMPALIDAFALAAERAVKGGFDAIMLHFGHGYLVNSFLSPLTNRRTDEYGGSLENRMRFPLGIVDAVRQEVGPDFPLIARLSAEDGLRGGIELPEAVEMAKMLEKASIDGIQVTAGIHLSMEKMVQPMSMPRGVLVPYAKAVKDAVKIPVGAVGRINNPEIAEDILQKGLADIIYLGRALIADPFFPQKVIENHPQDIRPCIACCQGCNAKLHLNETITCFGNPRVGREAEFPTGNAKSSKNILVIGGGPSGMEAALTAARRGYHVCLYERNGYLGGQLLLGSKPPQKGEIENLILMTERQLMDQKVQIFLNKKLDLADIKSLNPDAVIVAVGAEPTIPPIEGIHQPQVFTSDDVLLNPGLVKERVVLIGGGATGLETAELLSHDGCAVTVVELLPHLAQDLESNRRRLVLESLSEKGVRLIVNAKVKRITDRDVVIEWCGSETELQANYVVLATGIRPRKDFENLEEILDIPVFFAGSCIHPGPGIDAVREGFEAGYSV
ncbi:MAG: FAD-dependent oxidoreductase [Clostridiales bacterium]|jgi:2,4-dienoyl-CoA reductase-like NADH-dependent reductase (Old Yellow Enzyme family)/NADH dehydrogenase FAD-containing subunit|nr:FAD-dependent oxidoreductase [Clostridiales bacterium]